MVTENQLQTKLERLAITKLGKSSIQVYLGDKYLIYHGKSYCISCLQRKELLSLLEEVLKL